ncbi:hypothetical protein HD554DRAFT_2313150 [Boletus coccyginus]|nr:hypothetical protein HD554DRAFT_2313150 [Boletus coccyginus]
MMIAIYSCFLSPTNTLIMPTSYLHTLFAALGLTSRYGTSTRPSPAIPQSSHWQCRPSSSNLRPNTHHGVYLNGPPPRARRPFFNGVIPSTSRHNQRRHFDRGLRPWERALPLATTFPNFQIHPLLNGEVPRPDFYWDLALPACAPFRWAGHGWSVISAVELHEPATYPFVTWMRITHDAIPQWPIVIQFQRDRYTTLTSPPQITLGEVLHMIHASLHTQITRKDRATRTRISTTEAAIARAFTRRCQRVPLLARVVKSQGVKRIDYLLGRHVFRGLIRTHDEDGVHHLKLITGRA